MKHKLPRWSARRSTGQLLRRVSAVGMAAFSFAVATVDTAAEAGDFLIEGGVEVVIG